MIARIQRAAPTPLRELVPELPQAIQEIVDRAIAKLPEQRYQDLAIMAKEVARLRTKMEEAEVTAVRNVPVDVGDATIVTPSQARESQG